jgi:2'-5' RNA ligase
MYRLFVALPLPDPVRRHLALMSAGLPGARWVSVDNLHLTLRFIGEVDGGDAEDIHHALARIRAEPFDLSLDGIGCFESGGKVHTLWAGVAKQEHLHRLHEKIDVALIRSGLPADKRKFKPHVTLARFRNGDPARIGTFIARNNPFHVGPFRVEHFALFRSHLGGEGAHYEVLADYPLGHVPWPVQVGTAHV